MANIKIVDADKLDSDLTIVADAIRAKGGTTDALPFPNGMKTAIENIKSGGGGSVKEKDVNFYDYDGTLLHSYTVEEAQALSELPELPEQEGLICQGWNWSLDDIKAHNRAVDVGATYITDDGKTRLYIKIAAEGRMDVPLYFQQDVANGVTIDWGDGSATETLDGTGKVNTTHTYASIGEYVISLDVADGCTLGFESDSSKCVMGDTDTNKNNNATVYCNMLQKVEIGDRVTSIGMYAFSKCYSLKNISIPNSVTSMSYYAFQLCYSLKSIIMPNGVTSLSNNIYRECYSLENISIPNGVTEIGDTIFYYCHSLEKVSIPNGVTSIGYSAFSNCYSLKNIVIPNNVTSMGSNVIYECISLSNLKIQDGVRQIDSSSISRCRAIANIVIPKSVKNIGGYVFNYFQGMKFYDFSHHESVPTLGTNSFSGIPSDCEFRVPMALVDQWKSATNWANFADKIVGV